MNPQAKVKSELPQLTEEQKELINDNLHAFEHHFGTVRIETEDYGDGLYLFSPADSQSYIQFCYNIDYLNGYLYGAVQAVCKQLKPI